MSRLMVLVLLTSGCGARYAMKDVVIDRPGCAGRLTVSSTSEGRVVDSGPPMELVLEDTVVFSGDGRKAAYVARQGEEWFVVHEGQQSAPWEGLGFLRYGEVGPIYAGQRGGLWCVSRGGAEDACFSSIFEDSVTVAGKSVAYVARSEGDSSSTATASVFVVDGSIVRRGAELALVRGSEDGKVFGVVERNVAPEGLDRLHVGGATVATEKRIADWTPAGGVTWVSQHDGGFFVQTARWKLGPYLRVSKLITRGEHVAFLGSNAKGVVLVLDGVAHGPFSEVAFRTLVLSPSGHDFALVVKSTNSELKVATRYNLLSPGTGFWVTAVDQVVFSSDGKVLGAVAAGQNGLFSISLTNVATGARLWAQGGFSDVSDLALSPSGAQLLALVRPPEGGSAVFAHCPSCNTAPTMTPVIAMPGTLVSDPPLSTWAVLAGKAAAAGNERRLVIARSWGDTPIAFDTEVFGAEVVRLQRRGVASPVVAAWRSQVQSQLTRHLGCPAE